MDKLETFPPLDDDEIESCRVILETLSGKHGWKYNLLWRAMDELIARRRIDAGRYPYDDERQLELPATYHDRGYRYERTEYGDLEKAFADEWEADNKNGCGILQKLFIDNFSKWVLFITSRDRYVAATVVQWLGSNVGFGFLHKCLRKCGYDLLAQSERKHQSAMFAEVTARLKWFEDRQHRFDQTVRHPRKEKEL